MWFGVVTLFPEMFTALECGITGRALTDQLITLHCTNPRSFTHDKHHTVDDRPFGGGPGMLMKPEPLYAAIAACKAAAPLQTASVIYLSPQGRTLTQAALQRFAQSEAMILVSGRYEGIDERVIDLAIDEEWSIGDYILSGGELAAMVMIDAITRLLPGALGDESSAAEDSLANDLLKYPQYTRPREFLGQVVPDVLLSGNHADIEKWRKAQSLGRTWQKKPELLAKKSLNPLELRLLKAYLSKP